MSDEEPKLRAIDEEANHQIVHRRRFGKAQGATHETLDPGAMSDETIRRALQRLRTNWKRAKHWITSPDPQYVRKKSGAIV
jgi:hypothetical protein